MEFKVGNVKIHNSIAETVEKKSSRELRKKSEKIFGGLNKMNCLRGFRRTQTVYLEVKLNLEIGH